MDFKEQINTIGEIIKSIVGAAVEEDREKTKRDMTWETLQIRLGDRVLYVPDGTIYIFMTYPPGYNVHHTLMREDGKGFWRPNNKLINQNDSLSLVELVGVADIRNFRKLI